MMQLPSSDASLGPNRQGAAAAVVGRHESDDSGDTVFGDILMQLPAGAPTELPVGLAPGPTLSASVMRWPANVPHPDSAGESALRSDESPAEDLSPPGMDIRSINASVPLPGEAAMSSVHLGAMAPTGNFADDEFDAGSLPSRAVREHEAIPTSQEAGWSERIPDPATASSPARALRATGGLIPASQLLESVVPNGSPSVPVPQRNDQVTDLARADVNGSAPMILPASARPAPASEGHGPSHSHVPSLPKKSTSVSQSMNAGGTAIPPSSGFAIRPTDDIAGKLATFEEIKLSAISEKTEINGCHEVGRLNNSFAAHVRPAPMLVLENDHLSRPATIESTNSSGLRVSIAAAGLVARMSEPVMEDGNQPATDSKRSEAPVATTGQLHGLLGMVRPVPASDVIADLVRSSEPTAIGFNPIDDAAAGSGTAAEHSGHARNPDLNVEPESGPASAAVPTSGADHAAGSQSDADNAPTLGASAEAAPHELVRRGVETPTGMIAHDLSRQTVVQIADLVARFPDRPVELTLTPEELGKVTLTLSTSDRQVTVLVQTERPETLELLRRNIDQLAQELRSLGYADLSFSFAGNGEGGRGGTANTASHRSLEMATSPSQTTMEDAPLRVAVTLGSGLDRRF